PSSHRPAPSPNASHTGETPSPASRPDAPGFAMALPPTAVSPAMESTPVARSRPRRASRVALQGLSDADVAAAFARVLEAAAVRGKDVSAGKAADQRMRCVLADHDHAPDRYDHHLAGRLSQRMLFVHHHRGAQAEVS